jgi:hypothetical protein
MDLDFFELAATAHLASVASELDFAFRIPPT